MKSVSNSKIHDPLKNYGITVLKTVEEYLKKMKVSFEDLQVNYKIKLLTSIKNL